DLLHIAGTPCAGVGLSVVRADRLVVGVGAVTNVPLGNDVSARIPGDLIRKAEEVFRTRDPEFRFEEVPVELSIAGHVSIGRGGSALGDYQAKVHHGFYRGMPGVDECVAISRRGLCSDAAANASALLLDTDRLELFEG